ncbi:MAG: hypothetical protein JHC98_06765 [Thermoleophilaceae bacterium]|nr:hypothetical protein [Thermoleophilaceae bacterium]
MTPCIFRAAVLGLLTATLVFGLAPAFQPASAAVDPPAGDGFYAPPAELVNGDPGTVIWSRPAVGISALPAADHTDLVLYRSRSVDGDPIAVSGTVLIPRGTPPAGGWPIVSWGHVTTGAAESCAPSRVTSESPEIEMMTRGDWIVSGLLAAGVAVARTDDEGVGTPGPHPYMVGKSLARSQTEIVLAARELESSVGTKWAAAGHSEGGLGSLFTGQYASQWAPGLQLRAISALSPPTMSRRELQTLRFLPMRGGGLSGLAALIIGGQVASDARFAQMVDAGALSPLARSHLPDLEQRCFTALAKADSWGGIAPADFDGPTFSAAKQHFYDLLDASDPAAAEVGRIPVRIDQGMLDVAVPFPFQSALVARQRSRGANITYRLYPTASHPSITNASQAGPDVVSWLVERLR